MCELPSDYYDLLPLPPDQMAFVFLLCVIVFVLIPITILNFKESRVKRKDDEIKLSHRYRLNRKGNIEKK